MIVGKYLLVGKSFSMSWKAVSSTENSGEEYTKEFQALKKESSWNCFFRLQPVQKLCHVWIEKHLDKRHKVNVSAAAKTLSSFLIYEILMSFSWQETFFALSISFEKECQKAGITDCIVEVFLKGGYQPCLWTSVSVMSAQDTEVVGWRWLRICAEGHCWAPFSLALFIDHDEGK